MIAIKFKDAPLRRSDFFRRGEKVVPPPINLKEEKLGEMITAGNRRFKEIMKLKNVKNHNPSFFKKNWIQKPRGNKKDISEILKNGQWAGKRAFIIAGGPSVAQCNLNLLAGENTIGINRVHEIFHPTILFAMDKRFHNWTMRGEYGEEAKRRFQQYSGIKLWLDIANMEINDVYFVRSLGRNGLSLDLETGLFHGNNSGYGALNLAVALGASPIYLIGYDFSFSGTKSHFHDGHPTKFSEQMMKSFMHTFENQVGAINQRGVKVINCNRESKLKCFPFGSLPADLKVKAKRKPIYCSYFTNNGYENEVIKLKESIWKLSLNSNVENVKDKGSWIANVQHKAIFLKEMMGKYPNNPIVWVDADAEINSNPLLFDNVKEDFACYFRGRVHRTQHLLDDDKQGELLSGTLYFKNNKKSKELVDSWIEHNKKAPNMWDQHTLRRAWNDWKGTTFKLPAEYCCIFDGPEKKNIKVPVIEHFQASRKYKRKK